MHEFASLYDYHLFLFEYDLMLQFGRWIVESWFHSKSYRSESSLAWLSHEKTVLRNNKTQINKKREWKRTFSFLHNLLTFCTSANYREKQIYIIRGWQFVWEVLVVKFWQLESFNQTVDFIIALRLKLIQKFSEQAVVVQFRINRELFTIDLSRVTKSVACWQYLT